MKTKKLISFITVLALMTSAVFAAGTAVETEIDAPYTKTVKSGTFKSYDDGQLLLNDGTRDFAVNTDENTLFIDSDAKKFDITSAKNDTEFTVVADLAQTRSIPPQSYGYVVIAKTSDNMPIYVEVDEITDDGMVSADGKYIIRIPETAEIKAFGTDKTLAKSDIKADSKILVYSDIMTMSIPAQVPVDKIVVLDSRENNELSCEEILDCLRRLIKALGFDGIFYK